MSEQIIPNVVVSMPSQLFTLARKFQAASNGKIFIGKIDTDPTIPENQIQVYLENEDGTTVPVSQPLIINQAGYPVYNGQIAKFVTVQGHSMAVYDSYGAQQFYYPNVLKYDPDQFEKRFEESFPVRISDIFGVVEKTYENVNDLIGSTSLIGSIVKTEGLRDKNDNGGSYYKIVPKEHYGLIETKYPSEFGDIKLSNGNFAKRISEIKTQSDIRYWAHRGGQRDVAENTLFAFQQAIDNGAYGVELDCSMSSDGVWYVYHDASLYLQTNGTDFFYNRESSYIENLTFNKMKSSVYGSYIRIPRFSDFLVWAKNNGVPFTVEFKNPRPSSADADIAAGIQMIVDAGCELQSHVQVTVDSLAYAVRDISNDITISYSLSNLDNPDRDISQICRVFDKVIIQTNSNTINDSFAHGVKLALAMGSDVICYTGNDKEDDIKKILSVGVKNIISDRGWENK